ncbi:MAG: cytochrome c biogenesis protein CcdA [Prochlorotrichaceae cyanobacterium]|jgi:cytochrome c-type biogenesis protein
MNTWIYHTQELANHWVSSQLLHLTPLSLLILLTAGLMTSLTPCMISMLPITLGYLGGYTPTDGNHPRWQGFIQSLWFALGLATTLAGLGILATIVGRVYGQVGWGVSLIVSGIAIVMGLNLLELLPLQFPQWGTQDWIPRQWPRSVRSYGLGLTFGLVASPCSTPVLATLLAWISTTQDPLLGAGLLLAYGIGYVSPLIIAGTFISNLKTILSIRQWSGWINPTSGALLLGFGVFSLLTRIF